MNSTKLKRTGSNGIKIIEIIKRNDFKIMYKSIINFEVSTKTENCGFISLMIIETMPYIKRLKVMRQTFFITTFPLKDIFGARV